METDPPAGAQLPLNGTITLYFNQPMDAASVEGALSGEPQLSGSFDWPDEATLVFTPDAPFLPESDLVLTIADTAQSSTGDGTARTGQPELHHQQLPAPGAAPA